jgi:hypothetical protein
MSAVPEVVEDTWDSLTADMSVQQALVTAGGTVLNAPPVVDMTMERKRTATGWRTNVMLRRVDRPTVRTSSGVTQLDNPFLVVRMEYDGDGTAARFFNRYGVRVNPPGMPDRALLNIPSSATIPMPVVDLANPSIIRSRFGASNPEWMDNVVSSPGKRLARRTALERRYGAMRGRVNGMDQYVATAGDTTCEVLVNGEAVVPVEVNLARNAALVGRSMFTHERRPDGVMIRRVLHSEHASTIGKNNRAVMDVTMQNVVLSPAVAR